MKKVFGLFLLLWALTLFTACTRYPNDLEDLSSRGDLITQEDLKSVLEYVKFEDYSVKLTDVFLRSRFGLDKTNSLQPYVSNYWFPDAVDVNLGKLNDENFFLFSIPCIVIDYSDLGYGKYSWKVEFRPMEYAEYDEGWAFVDMDIRYENISLSVDTGKAACITNTYSFGHTYHDPLYSEYAFNHVLGTSSGRSLNYTTTGFGKLEDNYITGGTYLKNFFGGDCFGIGCEILLYEGPEADSEDTKGTICLSYTRHDVRTGEKKDFSYEIPLDYEIDLD